MPYKKLLALVAAGALCLGVTVVVVAQAPTVGQLPALDEAIAAQMRKHGLPGLSLAIVDRDGVRYLRSYGSAGNGRPMTPSTRMFIGSQSKSFTALAIAQLAEAGKLDLDAPVRRYIPWFAVADEAASQAITTRHLVRHVSGLADSGFPLVLPDGASPEEAVRALRAARTTAPVGELHQYFNLGYTVLSYLVELVSGQSYADYLRDHIFTPLGMFDTTAEPEEAHGLAQGYSRLFGFNRPMRQKVPAYAVGAGYIVSTLEDMARYARVMLNGAEGLVSPETARMIFTPGPGGYGFGWYIYDGGETVLHGGANETFRTDLNLYPREGRAFVMLVNQGHQFDHFTSAVQASRTVEAFARGRTPPPLGQGRSTRAMGHALGALTLALAAFQARGLFRLRSWRRRAAAMSRAKRALDIALSFAIPTAITAFVLVQVKAFYGYRFNLWPTLAMLPSVLPDVFIIMLLGTVPDYVQGVVKSLSIRPSALDRVAGGRYLFGPSCPPNEK